MKQFVFCLLLCSPFFCFSQGTKQTDINWITLQKAKEYSKKYNKEILIFFYKKDCKYCEKMKKEALSDIQVINLINNNFFPVKIDSRTKDTIYYKGVKYSNQQPISDGAWFRHDFYAEVATFTQNGTSQTTTPSIVVFNDKFEKIDCNCPYSPIPGAQSKQQLLRNLKRFIK